MKGRRVSRKGSVSLAVAAVRDLEAVLLQASRKRKLTADDRQKLTKCAAYLRGKRKKSVAGDKILLAKSTWVEILRFLADMVVGASSIKKVFDGLIGGK